MTIVEFLLARIAEDEARAPRKHGDYYREPCPKCGDPVTGIGSPLDDEAARALHEPGSFLGCQLTREQVAALMPDLGPSPEGARVLAECEAKQQIVELHPRCNVHDRPGEECDACQRCGDGSLWPCETLLAVASVYADHPDHDPAWRI